MKLVFLHGAGSSSLSYYYQLRHFRNSKAIDLPGHSTGTPCHNIDSYLKWGADSSLPAGTKMSSSAGTVWVELSRSYMLSGIPKN